MLFASSVSPVDALSHANKTAFIYVFIRLSIQCGVSYICYIQYKFDFFFMSRVKWFPTQQNNNEKIDRTSVISNIYLIFFFWVGSNDSRHNRIMKKWTATVGEKVLEKNCAKMALWRVYHTDALGWSEPEPEKSSTAGVHILNLGKACEACWYV